MIRQFFLNKVTIICTMICIIGCSTDSAIDDFNLEESGLEKQILNSDTTISLLPITVVYKKGTTEFQKSNIRSQYFNNYPWYFIEWTACNGYTDIWFVSKKQKPRIEVDESDEDLDRVNVYNSCTTFN